jgi:hypothetical protein
MYPGYLKVVVHAAITVETKLFVLEMVGFVIFKRSYAILSSAVLSKTVVASQFNVNLFKVNKEL